MTLKRFLYFTLVSILLISGCKKKSKTTKPCTDLFIKAARAGNVEEIRRLLDSGADINAQDRWGSPLHQVVPGDPNAAKLLIAAGANIESRNGEGDTPLIKASKIYNEEMVKILIDAGANVDAQGLFLNTPLHWAAEAGWTPIVHLLIENEAQVDKPNRRHETPAYLAMNAGYKGIVRFMISKGANVTLHIAAYLGDLEQVKNLIKGGAFIDDEDREGRTALHFAAAQGQTEVVAYLLANSADPNLMKRVDGATPLSLAVERGHKDVAELLLTHGADVNIGHSLQAAASRGDIAMVALLISQGADVNGNSDSMWELTGRSPLGCAIQSGRSEVVKLLLDKGANVNEKHFGDTNLASVAMDENNRDIVEMLVAAGADITIHLAAYLGNVEQTKRLLQEGIDVNQKDASDRTPLYFAVQSGHRELIIQLLEAGAEVNSRNHWYRNSPLHKAVVNGNKEIVELLIANGAFVDQSNHGGAAPLHLAARKGYKDVIELLLNNGANINPVYGDGRTVLDEAVQSAQVEIVEFLLAKGADPLLGLIGRDISEAEIDGLRNKELAEYLVKKYGPYSLIVTDPKKVREYLIFNDIHYDDLWIPQNVDLESISFVLEDHLRNGVIVGAKASFDRSAILANLKQYCCEYAGITRDGDKFIVCQMILPFDFPIIPKENKFTGIHGFGYGVVRFIFDVKRKKIVYIDCEYTM